MHIKLSIMGFKQNNKMYLMILRSEYEDVLPKYIKKDYESSIRLF